tara:strand:+ start:546 stop:767 length:222 start_codon:yes stop_codon:yes gene_type:complete
MEIFLLVITVIALYASYEVMMYNKIKKQNEKDNNEHPKRSYTKKKKPSGSTKVSKTEAQNKRKPGRPKKKIKK